MATKQHVQKPVKKEGRVATREEVQKVLERVNADFAPALRALAR